MRWTVLRNQPGTLALRPSANTPLQRGGPWMVNEASRFNGFHPHADLHLCWSKPIYASSLKGLTPISRCILKRSEGSRRKPDFEHHKAVSLLQGPGAVPKEFCQPTIPMVG